MSAPPGLKARASSSRIVGSEDAPALAAALLAVLLWASAFVAIRYVDRRLSPGALALGRLLVGGLGLGLVVLIRREPLPRNPRVLARVALFGFLWFGIYNVVLNEAERRVDAGTAAMLVNTGPIMIAILAGALLREGFPSRLFSGCLISFGGAALIGAAVSANGPKAGLGAALCVIAALAYAGGVVAQKPTLRSASPLSVTWVACTVGALCCLPYAPQLVAQAARGGASTVGWIIYLGVGPTAIGFVCWGYALSRTTAGRMGSTTYLVPPLAVLLGWVLLGEPPPLLALPGGLACLAGVAIARGGTGRTGRCEKAGSQAFTRSVALRARPCGARSTTGGSRVVRPRCSSG
jgi:drug/metabolite transporter (DMT)-like permease